MDTLGEPVRRHPASLVVATLSGAIAVLVFSAGALGDGSGYDQSFSRSPGSVPNSSVDVIALSSSDPGGTNITISLGVSGSVVLNSASYLYLIYIGGTTQANSIAYILFSNNLTHGEYTSVVNGGSQFGTIGFTLSGAPASTLTFSVAKGVVGSSNNFALNAYAAYQTSTQVQYSQLGTNYPGGGGCTSSGCTGGSAYYPGGPLVFFGIISAVVVVGAVAAGIYLLRRQRAQPPMTPPGPGPVPPEGPPIDLGPPPPSP